MWRVDRAQVRDAPAASAARPGSVASLDDKVVIILVRKAETYVSLERILT